MVRAVDAVTTWSFAVVAIDAPGHGDRSRLVQDERARVEFRQAQTAGDTERFESISIRYATSLAERAVPEWQATLLLLPECLSWEPKWEGGFQASSQQVTDCVDGSGVQRTAVRASSRTGVSVLAAQAWIVAARARALP
jgi:hypothetical protein